MASVNSSTDEAPSNQTRQQAASELLQAFQSSRPRREASSTPQPQPMSVPPRPCSPPKSSNQSASTGTSIVQQETSTTKQSTEETTARKRLHSSPVESTAAGKGLSDEDAHIFPISKRARQSSNKEQDNSRKPANASSSVQVEIPKRQLPPAKKSLTAHKESKALQTVNGNSSSKKARQSSTPTAPEDALAVKPSTAVTMNGLENDHPSLTSQSVQSVKKFATQLMDENQKLVETLDKQNGNFLNGIPGEAKPRLEAKLAALTAAIVKLHQEKVEAVKSEYVAELQRDVLERQKLIDMLLQKAQNS